MLRLLSLVSLLFLTLSQSLVNASPCLSFDINFNLLALGFGGKDYNVGTQDAWATGQLHTLFQFPIFRLPRIAGQMSSFSPVFNLCLLSSD